MLQMTHIQKIFRTELVEKAEAVESALKGLTEVDDCLAALESSFGQIAAEKPTPRITMP